MMTIITNGKKEALLPPIEDLKGYQNVTKHFYSIEGTGHKSLELVYRNLSSPLSLSPNQQLQIWYGQDLADFSEDNNSGETCVDVFAWFI